LALIEEMYSTVKEHIHHAFNLLTRSEAYLNLMEAHVDLKKTYLNLLEQTLMQIRFERARIVDLSIKIVYLVRMLRDFERKACSCPIK